MAELEVTFGRKDLAARLSADMGHRPCWPFKVLESEDGLMLRFEGLTRHSLALVDSWQTGSVIVTHGRIRRSRDGYHIPRVGEVSTADERRRTRIEIGRWLRAPLQSIRFC